MHRKRRDRYTKRQEILHVFFHKITIILFPRKLIILQLLLYFDMRFIIGCNIHFVVLVAQQRMDSWGVDIVALGFVLGDEKRSGPCWHGKYLIARHKYYSEIDLKNIQFKKIARQNTFKE